MSTQLCTYLLCFTHVYKTLKNTKLYNTQQIGTTLKNTFLNVTTFTQLYTTVQNKIIQRLDKSIQNSTTLYTTLQHSTQLYKKKTTLQNITQPPQLYTTLHIFTTRL